MKLYDALFVLESKVHFEYAEHLFQCYWIDYCENWNRTLILPPPPWYFDVGNPVPNRSRADTLDCFENSNQTCQHSLIGASQAIDNKPVLPQERVEGDAWKDSHLICCKPIIHSIFSLQCNTYAKGGELIAFSHIGFINLHMWNYNSCK